MKRIVVTLPGASLSSHKRFVTYSFALRFDDQAVVGRLDAIRQPRREVRIVEAVGKVGQDRAARTNARNPAERLADMAVGRMRHVDRRADDPGVGAGKYGKAASLSSTTSVV